MPPGQADPAEGAHVRPNDSKSFNSNVQLLFEELELATKWRRPSILVAVCKSALTQNKAQRQLEKQLTRLGHAVVSLEVDRDHADVPARITELGNLDSTFFFVSNLDQGGGEDGKAVYRALNMQRETFVEQHIKAVFWLTPSEASNLPRHAPDFWAFRHRVIEFATPRSTTRKSLPAGVLLWRLQRSGESAGEARKVIEAQESLLSQLPEGPESTAQRIELYEILGQLHWRLGEAARALDALSRGLAIAKTEQLADARAWLLNGVAIISYERRDFDKSHEIYTEILADRPQDGFLLMNLAVTLSALGRNREALFRSEQALKMAPADLRMWTAAGHLRAFAGKIDEAVIHFRKAADLVPGAAAPHTAIAVCYSLMGLQDEALRELALAVEASAADTTFTEACRQAVAGNGDRALVTLREALGRGELTAVDIQRDPNLAALLLPNQLTSLTA